jgi:hypothetical protein
MIPAYHLPAGYSSTYQRQIYGMEPVVTDVPTPTGLPTEARRRIFYAPPLSTDATATASKPPANMGLEPMTLGSDPITPPQPVRRTSYDSQ